MKRVLLAICIVFTSLAFRLSTTSAVASNYYVSLSGSDSNPGTQSQPWRTIQKAANSMAAGDTANVAAGSYPEAITVSKSQLTFIAQGTVTTKNWDISGDSNTMRGFKATDPSSNWGIRTTGNHNLIEGNEIYHTMQDGIWFFGNYNTYRGNYIHDILDPSNPTTHTDCFQTWVWNWDVTNALFEDNTCYNDAKANSGSIFMVERFASSVMRQVNNLTIRNNKFVIYSPTWSLFNMQGSSGYPLSNIVVENNTVYNASSNEAVGVSAVYTNGITIANNLFINMGAVNSSDAYVYVYAADNNTGIDIHNNAAYNPNGTAPKTTSYPGDIWMQDPKVVSLSGLDFHLQSTSPLLGKGASGLGVTTDFDGVTRDNPPDIGAFELASGTSSTPTPTKIVPTATAVSTTSTPTAPASTATPIPQPTTVKTTVAPTAAPVGGTTTNTNLIVNGSFDSIIGPGWDSGWNFRNDLGATFSQDTRTVATSSSKASLKAVVPAANSTQPWVVSVSQSNKSLTAGQTYTLSFWAKASVTRSIRAVMQMQNSPYAELASKTANLSTSWSRYYINFTPTSSTNAAMVNFNLAGATGTVWLDNVTLTRSSQTTSSITPTTVYLPTVVATSVPTSTASAPSMTNMVVDGSFETNIGTGWANYWSLRNDLGATFSQDTTSAANGSRASLKVVLPNSSSAQPALVSANQSNKSLTAGQSYTLTFWAKTSAARAIQVLMEGLNSPYTDYANWTVNLNTGWTRYTTNFTASENNNATVLFFNLAGASGTVWLDGVSLCKTGYTCN